MTDMSTASEQDWTAAIGAWNALGEGEQHIALGYLASQDPGLVRRAAAAAAADDASTGRANTAIAALDGRECRAALSALAVRTPGSVLAAIAEVTGA
jgi:hypothetical protein